jgi:hypothetical protein
MQRSVRLVTYCRQAGAAPQHYGLISARAFSASTSSPTRVCVVGSGPGGFYAAKYLLKDDPDVHVDVVDILPSPYGEEGAGGRACVGLGPGGGGGGKGGMRGRLRWGARMKKIQKTGARVARGARGARAASGSVRSTGGV